MKNNKSLIAYSICAVILILIAIFADYLTPFDPYEQDLSNALSPPDEIHLLGTDRYGRDVLSRVIIGSQTTLCSSIILLIVISIFGSAIGIICGFKGGLIDNCLMRITDLFLAFPQMIFAIVIAGTLGGGLINAVIAIALIAWTKYSRLARSLTLTVKNSDFIDAARISGATNFTILRKHILPNIIGSLLVTASLNLGTIIMELASLSFLGLGAQPPIAEWGAMMNNGRSMIQTANWIILSPGIAIFITVSIFNLLGDSIRDYFK